MNILKKIISFFLLFIFIEAVNTKAQVPDWEWARSGNCQDSNGVAESWNVGTDGFGNVYLAGTTHDSSVSFGSFTLYNQSSNYDFIFIIKYDSSGNVIWAKKSGGIGSADLTDLITDFYGNIYLTGDFYNSNISFGADTLNYNTGVIIPFVVKYDSAGNVEWAKSATGSNIAGYSWAVSNDIFGNVYMTGYYASPISN